MRILGIDPGTTIIGYGILEKSFRQRLQAIKYGCIKTNLKKNTNEKLKDLHKQLNRLIEKYKPDIIAVEKLFFFKNQKTVIEVSQARGVILLTAALRNIPVCEYTPLQIKIASTSYGRAEKIQVQKMVKYILRLKEIPKPDDVADALATAICCANSIK